MFLGFGKRIKSMLTDFACMFWTLIFPLCLSVLFSVTIPKVPCQQYDSIPIAVVNSQGSDHQLIQAVASAKTTNGKELFHVTLCTKIMAEEKLNNGDIVAYIDSHDKYGLYTKTNGIQVFLVKSFLKWYQQTEGRTLMNFNMQYIMEECTSEQFDRNVLYFLSLLCMGAILSMHWGVRIVTDIEGNLSSVGMRLSVTPVSKGKIIAQNFVVALLIEIIESTILLSYLTIVGRIHCTSNWYKFLLIQVLIGIIGILIGMLIGSNKKLSGPLKHRVVEYFGVFLGFLGGVMIYKIRFSLNEQFPYIMKGNPVNLGVEAMFQLCFVKDTSLYDTNLFILGILIVILTVITIYITRRKIYARI